MINARSETVAQKPAYRGPIKYRRCLIAADGFYEWKKVDQKKQPYYITMADGELFAFAGLWEHWQDEASSEIESCTILTTRPNEMMATIHDRMPVILAPEHYATWLDTSVQDAAAVTGLLGPYPPELMTAQPVSRFVNKPGNEGPGCVARAESELLFE